LNWKIVSIFKLFKFKIWSVNLYNEILRVFKPLQSVRLISFDFIIYMLS
jgi:hypothetical protein